MKSSITNKITAIILLVSIISVVILSFIYLVIHINNEKRYLENQLLMDANLIGEFCVLPLEFGDPERATQLLSTLSKKPHIRSCILFDERQNLFAYYGDSLIIGFSMEEGLSDIVEFRKDELHVVHPIVFNDHFYGALYFNVQTNLNLIIKKYISISLLLIISIGLISFFIAYNLQKIISRPVQNLVKIIKRVIDKKDYSIRTEYFPQQDEIGFLYKNFNSLLEAINKHEKDRDSAERKLQRREGLFRSLTENSEDLIFRFDTNCNIVFVNKEVLDFFKARQEELIEKPLTRSGLFNDDIRELLYEKIRDSVILSKTIRQEIVFRHRHYTASFDVRLTPEYDEDEKIVSVLGVARDISYLKNTEKALMEAKLKAEESDRLKSAFLANMSHEIRTPMNAIIGFSRLLTEKDITEEEKLNFINIINNRSNDLLQLINDIIDISKIESGQVTLYMENFNLYDLVYEIFFFYVQKLRTDKNKPEVQVLLSVDEKINKDEIIYSSPTAIKQVLNNLISNSIKFTKDGNITIGYKRRKNNEIEFFVSDTGIGIPEDKLQIVFERFRQVEEYSTRYYGGTGLGLAICKGIVEQLGGAIRVDSEKDKGSTFSFTLKIQNKKEEKPIEELQMLYSEMKDTEILVVEDDKHTANLIDIYLSRLFKRLHFADNADRALETFNNNKIGLILMDIQLPGMNGFEISRIIKEKKHEVVIIAQSAHVFETEREKAKQYGIDDYIPKPFNKQKLLDVIKKHLKVQNN